jgi:hypothetical protein
MALPRHFTDGSSVLLINDYAATVGAFTFEIRRKAPDGKWCLCCYYPHHHICLLDSEGMKMGFNEPEECVALFGNHSAIGEQWADFENRIRSALSDPFQMPAELANESQWLGTAGAV